LAATLHTSIFEGWSRIFAIIVPKALQFQYYSLMRMRNREQRGGYKREEDMRDERKDKRK